MIDSTRSLGSEKITRIKAKAFRKNLASQFAPSSTFFNVIFVCLRRKMKNGSIKLRLDAGLEDISGALSSALSGALSGTIVISPDVLVPLNVNFMKLSFDGRHDISLHLHGNVLRQHGQQKTFQFLVLVLHLQPGSDTVAGVEEGLPLRMLHQIVHQDPDDIDADKYDRVCRQLKFKLTIYRNKGRG